MTTEWAVSAAAEQIALDARNTGELMFTVANPGDAPDTVVFDIIPGDGSARSWFTVAEPQRPVPAHGSVTFLVKVAVPVGTAPRRYDLTGLAYSSSTAPEESSRSSGRITYEVQATEKPPNRLPWIIAAAVLVLVVGGVTAFLLTRSDEAATQELQVESLVPTAVVTTTGQAKIEEQKDTDALKFSGGGQALFTAFAIGDSVTFKVTVPKDADYLISQVRMLDATYANTIWGVDGKAIGPGTFLGYSPTPKLTGWQDVGTVHMSAGEHQLTLTVVGKTQATASYNAGVDAIRITEVVAAG